MSQQYGQLGHKSYSLHFPLVRSIGKVLVGQMLASRLKIAAQSVLCLGTILGRGNFLLIWWLALGVSLLIASAKVCCLGWQLSSNCCRDIF
jgi:hypothetical protein